MTGLDHYAEAKALLSQITDRGEIPNEVVSATCLAAQVHATLALVRAHHRTRTELSGLLNTMLDQISELRETQGGAS